MFNRVLSYVGLTATIGSAIASDMIAFKTTDGNAQYELWGDSYFHQLAPYIFSIGKGSCNVVYSQAHYYAGMSCYEINSWSDFMTEHITLCRSYLQPAIKNIENCLQSVINTTFHETMQDRRAFANLLKRQNEVQNQQLYNSIYSGAGYLAIGLGLFAAGYASYRAYKRCTHVANFEERLEKIGYKGEIPFKLCCPISHEIMNNPIVAPDGHTYDQDNLQKWLTINNTSPLTRAVFEKNLTLTQNQKLYDEIEAFVNAAEAECAEKIKKTKRL